MYDLLNIIQNVADMVPQFELLFWVVCFCLGVVFAMKSLMMFAKRQESGPGAGSWNAPIWMMVTAALFTSMPSLLETLRMTFFQVGGMSNPHSIFAESEIANNLSGEGSRDLIVGITVLVQFIGWIAVARGIMLMNASAQGGQGPKTFGPGLTHLIAGGMGANFPLFIKYMEGFLVAS